MGGAAKHASSSASASNQWATLSFVEVLEDLSSRFIVNLPSEELQRIERICFQVEQAHWFYEDFLRPLNASLPSLNLRKFSIYILQTASLSVPLIRQYISSDSESSGATVQWEALGGANYGLEAAFDEFMKYKTRVPVCGAVLVSDDWKSCLLVKGWKASASWGFPKGKINQSEPPRDCAVRETLEETGFDCSDLLPPDSPDWMELNVREQKIRLYIVPGVAKDTVFETQTRKEISKIAWFKLSDLPTWKQSNASGGGGLSSANAGAKFYLVTPFIGKLKHWIRENKKKALPSIPTQEDASAAPPTAPAALRQGSAGNQGNHMPPTAPAAMRNQESLASASPGAEIPIHSLFGDNTAAWPLERRREEGQQHAAGTGPSGPSADPVQPPAAGDSAVLLAMLKGSLKMDDSSNIDTTVSSASTGAGHPQRQVPAGFDHPGSSSSPLPAPRAQKSSGQTLKLLEMLSPNSPRQAHSVNVAERAQPTAAAADSNSDLTPEEADRNKKRALLLQQLMGGSMPLPGSSGTDVQSAQMAAQLSLEQQAPMTIGPTRGQQTQSGPMTQPASREQALLGMLSAQGGRPQSHGSRNEYPMMHSVPSPQPPHLLAYSRPDDPRHEPPPSPPVDHGRAALLSMLNAGPAQQRGPMSALEHRDGHFASHQQPPPPPPNQVGYGAPPPAPLGGHHGVASAPLQTQPSWPASAPPMTNGMHGFSQSHLDGRGPMQGMSSGHQWQPVPQQQQHYPHQHPHDVRHAQWQLPPPPSVLSHGGLSAQMSAPLGYPPPPPSFAGGPDEQMWSQAKLGPLPSGHGSSAYNGASASAAPSQPQPQPQPQPQASGLLALLNGPAAR